MKDSLAMGIHMATEEVFHQKEKYIKVILFMIKWKVKGSFNGVMEECMMACGKLERSKVWENSIGLMDKYMKANLKITNVVE